MKKSILFLIAIMTVIGFMVIIISCESEDASQATSNETLQASNECEDCPELKNVSYPLIYRGDFDYAISDGDGLFVRYFNENDTTNEFFVLQKDEGAFPQMSNITELYLYQDAFYLKANGTWLMFALSSATIEKAFVDLVTSQNRTDGYGVAYSKEPDTSNKAVSALDAYIARFVKLRKCDSGGPGANSCSISALNHSCNVTCESGYYACCMQSLGGLTCKCKKNE